MPRRGNSFANGNSMNNGQSIGNGPISLMKNHQAAGFAIRPETHWGLTTEPPLKGLA